jgi:hypothetical protein
MARTTVADLDQYESTVTCKGQSERFLHPTDALAEAQKLSWMHKTTATITDHRGRRRTIDLSRDRVDRKDW